MTSDFSMDPSVLSGRPTSVLPTDASCSSGPSANERGRLSWEVPAEVTLALSTTCWGLQNRPCFHHHMEFAEPPEVPHGYFIVGIIKPNTA